MKEFYKRHLNNWLNITVADDDERDEARELITNFCELNPQVLSVERMHSWTEIYAMAKRGFDHVHP